MKRLKLPFLCAVALGTLIGLFNVSNGSKTVVQAQDAAKAAKPKGPTTDKPAEQPDQRAAIDKTTQGFVEAFSRGDVEQLAAYLSDGAELVFDEAPPLRGRSAIVQALTKHFAEHPKKKSLVRSSPCGSNRNSP